MSTLALLLFGCAVHLGTIPVDGGWRVVRVEAPVAEPDVDAWVGEAVTSALAARGAHDPAGDVLRVTVTEASWSPARRSGPTLLYEARITLAIVAGERTGTRTRTWTVVDPGDAAGARALREDALRALARQVADDAVAWVLAR